MLGVICGCAGEEGVDEGGVRKEFFQLLIHQLFDFDFGMFRLTESKREIWYVSLV
jgi:ubiquitin-protein ligase E3 A